MIAHKKHLSEIVFFIKDAPDGGYTAHVLGESIFTEANELERLREEIRDAVRCHFPNEQIRSSLIHWGEAQTLSIREEQRDRKLYISCIKRK